MTGSTPPDAPSDPLQVAVLLAFQRHRGIAKAVPRGVILEEVNSDWRIRPRKISDSQFRVAKQALIKAGHLLCSHQDHGYWLAENWSEVDKCRAYLRPKAITILDEISDLDKNALKQFGPQRELPI